MLTSQSGYWPAVYARKGEHVTLTKTPRQRRSGSKISALASAGHNERPFKLALKEWAVTCAALEAGEQTILLRKGGIKEPGFSLPALHFLLFPNAFHTSEDYLTPCSRERYAQVLQLDPKQDSEINLSLAAEVTGAWTTNDPNVLLSLSAFHIWSDDFIQNRLEWRKAQPVTILELRCSKLKEALRVPQRDAYWGCFSFVELEDPEVIAKACQEVEPVLSDSEFRWKQAALRDVLQQTTVQILRFSESQTK